MMMDGYRYANNPPHINIIKQRKGKRKKKKRFTVSYNGVLGILAGAGAFSEDLVVAFLVYGALAHCKILSFFIQWINSKRHFVTFLKKLENFFILFNNFALSLSSLCSFC